MNTYTAKIENGQLTVANQNGKVIHRSHTVAPLKGATALKAEFVLVAEYHDGDVFIYGMGKDATVRAKQSWTKQVPAISAAHIVKVERAA